MIPNIQDHFGRSALHYAILYGQNILIEPLLANGFDPNLPDTEEGMTPMLIACTVGRMSLVDELLKNVGLEPVYIIKILTLEWQSSSN